MRGRLNHDKILKMELIWKFSLLKSGWQLSDIVHSGCIFRKNSRCWLINMKEFRTTTPNWTQTALPVNSIILFFNSTRCSNSQPCQYIPDTGLIRLTIYNGNYLWPNYWQEIKFSLYEVLFGIWFVSPFTLPLVRVFYKI